MESKDDRHGMERKCAGYPQGQSTYHLDGRIVRDVIRQDVRAQLVIPNGFFFIGVPVGVVPPCRARYIDFISISGSTPYNVQVWMIWQLWAAGKFIMSGTFSQKPCPIKVYFPPETVLTFYIGAFNGTGANVYGYGWMSQIEYNAEIDIWEYGNGGNVPNPPVLALPWP